MKKGRRVQGPILRHRAPTGCRPPTRGDQERVAGVVSNAVPGGIRVLDRAVGVHIPDPHIPGTQEEDHGADGRRRDVGKAARESRYVI